jgi:uncharacterized protein (UPF0248 family)
MSQGGNTTTSTKAESEHLASLRRLAQEHLQEIGEQEEKERLEDQEVKRVQEEEVMRRTKSRAAQPAAGAAETSPEKGSRMRTAQGMVPYAVSPQGPSDRHKDVLDRIRWDPSYDVKAYIIGYLDRFGGVKEIHAPIWLDDSTEEDWVPQHRIRYFKKLLPGHGEEIVWHRFERIDKVFGSTAAPPT